jgi:hypothetical protein
LHARAQAGDELRSGSIWEAIDQAPFNVDPRIGLIVGVMAGFPVFAAPPLRRDIPA